MLASTCGWLRAAAWNSPGAHCHPATVSVRGCISYERECARARRELAILSSVSQAAIADIEANRPGHLAILERLADGLGAGLTLVPAGQAASFFSMACDIIRCR